ncbi:ABC transporter permease [Opitutus sp. ER46]|uniref:ABC transporter permease n=1 Tax=Opitutus sp. ER46 TaxID=2161864 RepID=UPI000D3004F5|nr:ABC transporter permease [Opitutus sp. ER46]PTY00518.1 ABC transporter permease [Opitutus sp. ER46]
MAAADTPAPGFWRCLRREWPVLLQPAEQAGLLWLPLAGVVILAAIFARSVITDLPIAVIDQDATATSRQLVRWLDATPGLRVVARPVTPQDGWAALRRGDVYAVVQVPRDLARDLKQGRAADVPAWYNAQFLTASSTVARDLQAAVTGFATSVEAKGRLARGETREIALLRLNPIGMQRTMLFNPQMNYGPFLVTALGVTVLHIAAMMAAVRAIGRELRDGTAPDWLASAGGSRGLALAGKLAVPFGLHLSLGLGMLAFWHGVVGWPIRGNGALLALALVAMIAAYYALGATFVLVTSNYRLASGAAAFFTAPALAFAGITFPLDAMPGPAWAWGRFLPLTSYLQLQVEQTARGASVASSLPGLFALLAYVLAGTILAFALLPRRARNPADWGHR